MISDSRTDRPPHRLAAAIEALPDYYHPSGVNRSMVLRLVMETSVTEGCRVYWGSHGCDRERGHAGSHACDSCFDPLDNEGYVGVWPYYGPETRFYGEDAPDAGPREGGNPE